MLVSPSSTVRCAAAAAELGPFGHRRRTVEASEFRAAFASFSGPDRYRQFLRALNRGGGWRGRLLSWQEELLARFAEAVPSAEVTFERVESLLRVCELHGAELAPDRAALPS
jgi:hypothetical protein